MVSSSLLATAAALLAVVSAAPTQANTFSIPQVAVNQGFKLNGVQKTAQVYRKYKGQMPAALEAAAAQQTGTVVATPGDQYDSEYTCTISVGGQSLPLDFDTGSADLFVIPSRPLCLD
jgi:aspergillopepsin I